MRKSQKGRGEVLIRHIGKSQNHINTDLKGITKMNFAPLKKIRELQQNINIPGNIRNIQSRAADMMVRVHKKPKTERLYERVSDACELCRIIEKHGERTAFSYFDKDRNIEDMTYAEFSNMIKQTAAGFDALGFVGKRIAVIGDTSPQWLATYLGVLACGGTIIPMDKELEISVIEKFLESVEAEAIVYSSHFNGCFENAGASHKTLKLFVPITPGDDSEKKSKSVLPFEELLQKGKKEIAKGYNYPRVTDREKLAEMLFTSGTTGTSKCVMLSQKNVFSVVTSAAASVDFNPDDTVVSVLPVHHTYELACLLAELDYGLHICINDSLMHVIRNFQIFKPTGLVLVPLFVYTMYKKIWNEAKKSGKDKKLKAGIGASKALMTIHVDKRNEIFSEVLEAFGGRLEKIICGGAALNPKMIEFFENIGISIYEGFGITECAPLTCVTPYYARKYGSVGPAVPCCQVRIAGSLRNSQGYIEGELQVKGDNVMLGYYNNEEATRDAFTDDGWFRTGDVAYMDSDGYVFITGRLKTVIVLENGKNVFPEEIEEYLGNIEQISECVVVGRTAGKSEKVNLTAIVYPDFTKFPENATDEEILASIEKSVDTMNKKLPTYKQVKKVELRKTEFEKTTSRKIKRHLVK